MTFQQEFQSWRSPPSIEVSTPPAPGSPAPSTGLLSFPYPTHKPVIVTFLRHCGCPFSEKTFRDLRASSSASPDIVHIAVSHSNRQHTDKWLSEIGGAGNVTVLIDEDRTTYARWGLGPSSLTHVLSLKGLIGLVKVGRSEGIWNRPTESGSRWQTSGTYAVNKEGTVVWGGPAKGAEDVPVLEDIKAKL